MRHPAKYTPAIVDIMVDRLGMTQGHLLDPFAGMGLQLHKFAIPGREITGLEIEKPWADAGSPYVRQGDSTHTGLLAGCVDMIATSPTYGNRFADHHNAKDTSKRRSYTHDLRHSTGDAEYHLSSSNTGLHAFHASGNAYKVLHQLVWAEMTRVAAPGCIFLLNVSDYIHRGVVQPVTLWHLNTLTAMGWQWTWARAVETPRMRHGANNLARVSCEWVHELRKAV